MGHTKTFAIVEVARGLAGVRSRGMRSALCPQSGVPGQVETPPSPAGVPARGVQRAAGRGARGGARHAGPAARRAPRRQVLHAAPSAAGLHGAAPRLLRGSLNGTTFK